MKMFSSVLLLLSIPATLAAGPSSIYLKDGRIFSGRFLEGNTGTISFQDDSGRDYRFRTADVDRISFITDSGNRGYLERPPEGRSLDDRQGYNQGNNASSRILPAGAEISVRTTSTINSKNASEGQIFSASVERDVLDSSGAILIPRGSPADLIVRDVEGGSTRNSNNLILDVQSVSVNGQRFFIDTEDLTQSGNGRQGIGANRRTGEFVGGGTALGTLLGAVAGGGKGALIGALAGAAAGAGTQVLTRGNEVRVPSETVLTFRIDRQVFMNERN